MVSAGCYNPLPTMLEPVTGRAASGRRRRYNRQPQSFNRQAVLLRWRPAATGKAASRRQSRVVLPRLTGDDDTNGRGDAAASATRGGAVSPRREHTRTESFSSPRQGIFCSSRGLTQQDEDVQIQRLRLGQSYGAQDPTA